MSKTILVTGSTDGIGLATALSLAEWGHCVLLHGRNEAKLQAAKSKILSTKPNAKVETYNADLSISSEVLVLAKAVRAKHKKLDGLINNAGVYIVPETVSSDGLDVRFMVNTISPFRLMKLLLPIMGSDSRVINLSSAAQAALDPVELAKPSSLDAGAVYARSKLALTMWTRHVADSFDENQPAVIAVNPGSLLGSKMVKEAFGIPGGDIQKGADVLVRAVLSEEFATRSGEYFDNDSGQFASPHTDALDAKKNADVVLVLEAIIARL